MSHMQITISSQGSELYLGALQRSVVNPFVNQQVLPLDALSPRKLSGGLAHDRSARVSKTTLAHADLLLLMHRHPSPRILGAEQKAPLAALFLLRRPARVAVHGLATTVHAHQVTLRHIVSDHAHLAEVERADGAGGELEVVGV